MNDLIPNNLPYQKFRRDEIDTENLTWFEYIIGRFSGEMWWERDDIHVSGYNPKAYHTIPFPEDPGILHLWFFGKIQETDYRTNIPWLSGGSQCAEELRFYPDTQCRFDIWTLYNHPPEEVNLEIGGTAKIEILPKQEDLGNVPALTDTVPFDVPLIFGPRINLSDSSVPHRPFVQNNSQISNLTSMRDRLNKHMQEVIEKEKRQKRQYAQRQEEKRLKWQKAQRQQHQSEQHQRKQRQKDQDRRRRARRGSGVPPRVLNS